MPVHALAIRYAAVSTSSSRSPHVSTSKGAGMERFSPLPKNQRFSHTAPQAYSFKIVIV